MIDQLPDHNAPPYQRLALLLARVGRQFSELGLTDPDEITRQLIIRSLLAEPLLAKDRPLFDIGSGVGIPGLPLALSRPDRSVYLIEPNQRACSFVHWIETKIEPLDVELINNRLEKVDFSDLPRGQIVSRAALGLNKLLVQPPADFSPILKWSGDKTAPEVTETSRVLAEMQVSSLDASQNFVWAGNPKMFHVKQNEWEQISEINYKLLSSPPGN